jgi:alkanesulfonate monooxygenase SsuD/methylene tetrahydromethanopterin reductase-like flavin-dependent oxidoreductase (luciferase family)
MIADSISAKRQNWIDEFRAEMAEFLTAMGRLNELRRPPPTLTPEQAEKNFEESAENNFRAHELAVRMKLRMNPKEDDHNKLDALLKDLADASADPPASETPAQAAEALEKYKTARAAVIAHMQTILKHEWERVKRGDM